MSSDDPSFQSIVFSSTTTPDVDASNHGAITSVPLHTHQMLHLDNQLDEDDDDASADDAETDDFGLTQLHSHHPQTTPFITFRCALLAVGIILVICIQILTYRFSQSQSDEIESLLRRQRDLESDRASLTAQLHFEERSNSPKLTSAFDRFRSYSSFICHGPGNIVLNRGVSNVTELRVWSINEMTYHSRMNHTMTIEQWKEAHPNIVNDYLNLTSAQLWDMTLTVCRSHKSLVKAISSGRRSPVSWARFPTVTTQLSGFDPFTDESFFTPFGCNYRWFSPKESCQILSSFANIRLIGDSLTRHTMMGMINTLTLDGQIGAIPPDHPFEMYQRCQCDGQFSEHNACRIVDSIGAMSNTDATPNCPLELDKVMPVCQGTLDSSTLTKFPIELMAHTGFEVNQFWLTDEEIQQLCPETETETDSTMKDHRPIMFYLQHGLHYLLDTHKLLQAYHESGVLDHLVKFQSACERVNRKVIVLIGGTSRQADRLEKLYPWQDMTRSLTFDQSLRENIQRRWPTLQHDFIEWFNFSHNAPTSDGVHGLQEMNLIRAQVLLNYMNIQSHAVHQ